MKKMGTLAFTDKNTTPDEEQVSKALGDSIFLLEELLSEAGIDQRV